MKRNQPWFMRNQFELGIFCKSRFTSNDTNILNRLRTSVINAVNTRVKWPKIIVIILERDFIESLQVEVASVSILASLYGTWIEWLSQEISDILSEANKALPVKAKRAREVMVYWTAAVMHNNYEYALRAQIAKFNNCLDSVMKIRDNMRVIKLKKGWNNDNSNLVSKTGRLMHEGLDCLWAAIDASVEFNYKKRLEFLARKASTADDKPVNCRIVIKQDLDSIDPMLAFFKKTAQYGAQSHWSKNGQRREDRREDRCHDWKHSSSSGQSKGRFMLPRLQF